MKAAWYEEQGEPAKVFKVGELPDQEPGPAEVKVRIRASGANPTDTYTRSGVRGRGMPFARIVPHQDGAGVIVAVGDGVPKERIGERVWLFMAQWQRALGTAAEFCVLPSGRAAKLPDNCSFNDGACLGVPWLTAHYAGLCDGPVAGRTVLVAGGTGAVGYYAVQIAKHEGARVIATVGSAEKQRGLVTSYGSTEISPASSGGREVYRVRLGPYSTQEAAGMVADRLRRSGYGDARVVSD